MAESGDLVDCNVPSWFGTHDPVYSQSDIELDVELNCIVMDRAGLDTILKNERFKTSAPPSR